MNGIICFNKTQKHHTIDSKSRHERKKIKDNEIESSNIKVEWNRFLML